RAKASLAGQVGQIDEAAGGAALIEHRLGGDQALLERAILPGVVGARPQADLAALGHTQKLAVVAPRDLRPALAGHAVVERDPGLSVALRQHPPEVERIAHAVGIARAVGERVALADDDAIDVALAHARPVHQLHLGLPAHKYLHVLGRL